MFTKTHEGVEITFNDRNGSFEATFDGEQHSYSALQSAKNAITKSKVKQAIAKTAKPIELYQESYDGKLTKRTINGERTIKGYRRGSRYYVFTYVGGNVDNGGYIKQDTYRNNSSLIKPADVAKHRKLQEQIDKTEKEIAVLEKAKEKLEDTQEALNLSNEEVRKLLGLTDEA